GIQACDERSRLQIKKGTGLPIIGPTCLKRCDHQKPVSRPAFLVRVKECHYQG
ncbi:hypothetical protein LEMLEM_LOCUS19961, partial [Lemmus lemmus]